MIPCIGLASGLGGRNSSAGEGPHLLRSVTSSLVDWRSMVCAKEHSNETSPKWESIPSLNELHAKQAFQLAQEFPFFISIGGDHSCAVGTWSGVSEARRLMGQELALLWFDAHMDCHTHDTSESGNIHGMPLAALLGQGSPKLTQILSPHPKFKPENVFIIGVRSYEAPEKALIERLGVRVYYQEEVQEKGLEQVVSEILTQLSERYIAYGISMDIDFFTPEKMSATGSPETGGVTPEEFIDSYSLFEKYPPIAFEYVEFNPSYDCNNQSLEHTVQILKRIVRTGSLQLNEALL